MKEVFGCGRFLTIGAPKTQQVQLAKNAYMMTNPCILIAACMGFVRLLRFFRRMRS